MDLIFQNDYIVLCKPNMKYAALSSKQNKRNQQNQYNLKLCKQSQSLGKFDSPDNYSVKLLHRNITDN